MSTVIDMSKASDRKDVALTTESTALISVIERAARDPNIDIDKMERLLAMQEKIFAKQAETAFNQSMSACQAEMPQIIRQSKNDQTNSLYAALEEIDRVARPVYTKHGFALSFGTIDCPIEGCFRQTCLVSHIAGHSRQYQADLVADLTGIKGNPNKTGVQGFGSTMSYGQRYMTKLVFNIVLTDEDNDGNGPTLSKDQIATIERAIVDSGSNRGQFLEFWRIRDLEHMPAFNFPMMMDMLERRAKRGPDPRGDTSKVDFKVRDKWVSDITDILNQDKDEHGIAADLQDAAAELNKFPELYITVLDELARLKIISKANFRKFTGMLVDRNNHG